MSKAYWDEPRYVKMKRYTLEIFDGHSTIDFEDYSWENCVALIMITGEITDYDKTNLHIGFTSDATRIKPPDFSWLSDGEFGWAVGLLTYHADRLGSVVPLLKEKEVYIRIGGDGKLNGILAGTTEFTPLELEERVLNLSRPRKTIRQQN